MSTKALQAPLGGVIEQRRTSPGLLLALLGQHAMRRMREVHLAHDLTPRQFQLLGLLHEHGARAQGELGATMGVDPSILVTLLNPLEARGYVLRSRDPLDRRRHVVSLTVAGEAELDTAAEAQRAVEGEIFAGLDGEQREQLRGLLLALRESLAADSSPACEGAAAEDC